MFHISKKCFPILSIEDVSKRRQNYFEENKIGKNEFGKIKINSKHTIFWLDISNWLKKQVRSGKPNWNFCSLLFLSILFMVFSLSRRQLYRKMNKQINRLFYSLKNITISSSCSSCFLTELSVCALVCFVQDCSSLDWLCVFVYCPMIIVTILFLRNFVGVWEFINLSSLF